MYIKSQGTGCPVLRLNPGQDTRAHNTNPAQSHKQRSHYALNHAVPHTPPPRSLTSRSEALVSRHDALLRQLHRPLRPCLRLLRALALQVALAPDLVELQACAEL